MAWLTRILAGFLVASICGLVFSVVLSRTILSSTYLKQKAQDTNTYSLLSTAINNQIKKDAATNSPQADAAISSVITPTVVQQKVNNAFDQLGLFFKGGSTVPNIDFSGEVSQARALGLPISPDSTIAKPINLPGSKSQTQTLNKNITNLKTISIIGFAVILVVLLLLSWMLHRYTIIPNVLITSGVIIGIVGGLFYLLPGLANHFIKLDIGSNDFAAIAHNLVTSILRDLSRIYGIIGLILIGVGVALRIIVGRFRIPPTKSTYSTIR